MFKKANRLSLQLLFYILLCSSIFTLIGTSFQLYLEYRSDIKIIESSFSQIKKVSLKPLATGIWNFNRDQLYTQLEGLISIPDITYAEIRELHGKKERLVISIGALPLDDSLTRVFPLKYQTRSGPVAVGSLRIAADLSKVYDRLWDKTLLVTTTQAIETFFVSILILLIFHTLIMKHLHAIARHMREIHLARLEAPLYLKRKPYRQPDPDLLDEVAGAINDMQSRLREDVTALASAEKALQESKEKYKTLFNSSPVSIWQLDLRGIRRHMKRIGLVNADQVDEYIKEHQDFIEKATRGIRVLDLNQATLNIFKAESKRELLTNIRTLFQKSQLRAITTLLKAMCTGSDYFESEFRGKNLKDEEIQLVIQCFLPKREEQRDEAIATLTDITERKRIEGVLVQSEKLASIGNLAAGMAHEINNPLGAILQSAQNIRRRTSDKLVKNQDIARELGINIVQISEYMEKREVNRFIDMILKSGERAARIITKMLQFSRRSESKIVETNMESILNQSIELATTDYDLGKRFDFKHIEIVKDYTPEPVLISVTESEMEQVFLNLLKNAAHALFEPQPTVDPRIVLRTRQEPGEVVVEVEDNGPGMDEKTAKSIFEPFFTTKPLGQGTGLGLSVSYMIITNNHHGTMTVDSKPGEGTRFTIRLPLS